MSEIGVGTLFLSLFQAFHRVTIPAGQVATLEKRNNPEQTDRKKAFIHLLKNHKTSSIKRFEER